MLNAFHNVHHLSYLDPRYSLVSLGLPYAVENPGLLHAFAACGAAFLVGQDVKWERISLAHHVLATRSILTSLRDRSSKNTDNDEWLLASIMLLHIVEVSRDTRPPTIHHLRISLTRQ